MNPSSNFPCCLHPLQLLLQLLDRRQAALQAVWDRLSQPVLSHAYWLMHISPCVLHHHPILFPAEQNADGCIVMRMAQQIVVGGKVEVQLARIPPAEFTRLQLHHN